MKRTDLCRPASLILEFAASRAVERLEKILGKRDIEVLRRMVNISVSVNGDALRTSPLVLLVCDVTRECHGSSGFNSQKTRATNVL
jgi:hypothetical protein